jgi:hypothetical protein
MLLLRVLWMQRERGLAGCTCSNACGCGCRCGCRCGRAGRRDASVQRQCVLQDGAVHDAGQSLRRSMLDHPVHPCAVLPRVPQLALVRGARSEPRRIGVLDRPHPRAQIHELGAATQRGGTQRVRRTLQRVANAERIGNAAAHSQLIGGRTGDERGDFGRWRGCGRHGSRADPRTIGAGVRGGSAPLAAPLRHADVPRGGGVASRTRTGRTGRARMGWVGNAETGKRERLSGAEGGRDAPADVAAAGASQPAAATSPCTWTTHAHNPHGTRTADAQAHKQQRAWPWRRKPRGQQKKARKHSYQRPPHLHDHTK